MDKYNVPSETWLLLKEVISGNLVDPLSRGSKWIFSSYPQISEGREDYFPGFPIIVIEDPRVSSSPRTWKTRERPIDTVISVYDTRTERLSILTGSINGILEDNEDVFVSSGLKSMEITSNPSTDIEISRDNIIHEKNIGVGFVY